MSVAESAPIVGARRPAPFDAARAYLLLGWLSGALLLAAIGIASARAYAEWIRLGVVMPPGDLDPYIRLVRVRELLAGQGWYDALIPGGQMGAAEYLAWSRPLDLLIAGIDWPLRRFLSEGKALLIAGSLVSPLLLVACVPCLVHAARTLGHGIFGTACVLLAFACHPLILPDFRFGRGDHHSLLLFCLVAFAACFLRALQTRSAHRLAWSGVVAGLGIWVHPEFILFAALAVVFLGLQWCRGESSAAQQLGLVAAGACAAIVLGLVSEAGASKFLAVEHDRVSIVHLTLFAVVLAGALVLRGVGRHVRSVAGRASLAGMLGAVCLAALEWLYPGFHLGPVAVMDPQLHSVWFERLVQSQPLLRVDVPDGYRYVWITGLLFAYGLLHLGTLRLRVAEERRRLLDFLLVSIVGCFIMALAFRRAAAPMALFCVLPIGFLADHWLARHARAPRPDNRFARIRRVVALQGFVFCCAMAPHLVLAASDALSGLAGAGTGGATTAVTTSCRRELHRWIQQGRIEALSGLDSALVVTRPSDAPALLFWSRHRVVAWNHHRSAKGLILLDRFFRARSEAALRDVVSETRADLILYCPRADSTSPYWRSTAPLPLPPWLQPLAGAPDEGPVLLRIAALHGDPASVAGAAPIDLE